MNQLYQEKISFNNKDWYQLEWNDIDFKDLGEISNKCSNIEELSSEILKKFPDSKLIYKYVGEKKNTVSNNKKKK